MIDLANNTVRSIGILYRYMVRALDIEMAPLGMGAGRFRYLFILYIDEGLTQQEIAFWLQADKAAVARTLAQMERQGYVRRCNDRADKRLTRVFLTKKSEALRPALEAAVERIIGRLTADLPAEERSKPDRWLKQMAQSLADHYDVTTAGKTQR
jgi:DNA-binding MarR family transcriptional regulator